MRCAQCSYVQFILLFTVDLVNLHPSPVLFPAFRVTFLGRDCVLHTSPFALNVPRDWSETNPHYQKPNSENDKRIRRCHGGTKENS